MKTTLKLISILSFVFLSFTSHKYYLSVSEVEYVKQEQSIQVISRFFVDDFEKSLSSFYGNAFHLATKTEIAESEKYISKYIKSKFVITKNGKELDFKFIGKKYEGDEIICYLKFLSDRLGLKWF